MPTDGELTELCRIMRRRILTAAVAAGAGHIAPAYSVLEILAAFYFRVLRVDPARPDWQDRDRLILSKGHGCLAQYVALAERGFFARELLGGFTGPGSVLGGHPDRKVPGIESATGSLGHGLSVGVGLALAASLDGRGYRTFVVLSDGECQEGSVWEAVMFATHLGLDNLIVVVDHNRLQSLGLVEDIMSSPTSLADKWRAFGWAVAEVDGHDVQALTAMLQQVPLVAGRPTAIVAATVKGKGVSFMEGQPIWHYRLPSGAELAAAWQELGGEGPV